MIETMDGQPRFFMYLGDGEPSVMNVVRACTPVEKIYRADGMGGEEEVLVVRIDPPLSGTILADGASSNFVGLERRTSSQPVDSFGKERISGAVVWLLREDGRDNFIPFQSVGLIVIRRDRPEP